MFQTFSFTIMVAAFTFAIGAADVIHLMAAPRFHAAASVVPILLVAHVITGMSLFFNSGLLVRNRTALLGGIALVTALVNVAANAILVPIYLTTGAALARVLALAVMAALTYRTAQRLWPQRLDFAALAKVAALACALYVVSRSLPEAPALLTLGLKALLVPVLIVASVLVGAVDRAEVVRLYTFARARLRLRAPAADGAR
jgi:O-antigen/teichoic acid export membrane protein